MIRGLELMVTGTMCLALLAVTLIPLTNATSGTAGVADEVNSLQAMIPSLFIAIGISVALASVAYVLKGRLRM